MCKHTKAKMTFLPAQYLCKAFKVSVMVEANYWHGININYTTRRPITQGETAAAITFP